MPTPSPTVMERPSARRAGRGLFSYRQNCDLFPAAIFDLILDYAIDQGKKSIILTQADVVTGVDLSACLTNEYVTRSDDLAAEAFDA